ncbi:MAG: DUF6597 domain-containing transcriptional factor [Propylenella sp.]
MLFRSYVPGHPLGGFVEDFWVYENYAGDHQRELILPSGTFEMVFSLREDEIRIYDPRDPRRCRRFSGALVSGPYAGPFMSDTAEEGAILGVHFRPGGAAALLGSSAREFCDLHVDLRALWGPAANTLRERLCALREPIERFRLLEQALLARIAPQSGGRHSVRAALDMLVQTHGSAKTRDIAKGVDLSQRRIIELFAAEVGLTPKLFGRILRFQRAVAGSQSTARIDWARLAVECGYFDQAHLVHDFTEFAGVSPSEHWQRQSELDRKDIHVKRHHLPLAA